MGKIYRTAQGRELDIEKLRLQHEMVPALGNMKVNARGDQLGPGGKVLKTREQIMDDHYRSQPTANVPKAAEGPMPVRNPRAKDVQPPPKRKPAEESFTPGDAQADPEQVAAETQTGLKGGLARAVKKAQDGEKKGIKRL